MYSTLDDMVVIITGRDMTRFGTGFVIHKDQQATYLLTCTHVVNNVGGEEELKAHHKPATLIASDPEFDLAVLRVEEVLDTPTLLLKIYTAKDRPVALAGFYLYGQQRLSQKITGRLNEHGKVISEKLQARTVYWHLEIQGDYPLEPGYSGAPIVDEETGRVIGVVNQRRGKGEKGLVISIEALKKIWPDMPPELLVEPSIAREMVQDREPLINLTSELDAFMKTAFDNHQRVVLQESPEEPPHIRGSERQSNAQKFNLKNIRSLLVEGFTDDELRRLCYDEPDFRPVYDQLSPGMGKNQVIDKLIEYAERRELIERLLTLTRVGNPKKYKKYQPYDNLIDNPIISSGLHGETQRDQRVSPAPSTMNQISLSLLRRRLNFLDDPEFDAFCLENFPKVYDKFGRGLRKDEKITLLLDHCRRNSERMQKLISLTEEFD